MSTVMDTSHLACTVNAGSVTCDCGQTFPTIGRGERRESPEWHRHARTMQTAHLPEGTRVTASREVWAESLHLNAKIRVAAGRTGVVIERRYGLLQLAVRLDSGFEVWMSATDLAADQ